MEERLKKFAQLVDAGSYVLAAQELHVSQPALSVAVAKLERELHAPLVVRGARPLKLTSAGELAYATGKEIASKTGNLKTLLAELAEREVTVSVGMIDSIADVLFSSPESVAELERNASVSLVVDNSRNLLQAVEQGALDLAFVVGQREYASAVAVAHRASEPLVLVCHAQQVPEVEKAMQSGILPRFISYNQASSTHQLVASALRRQHLVPQTTFYSTSPEVMLRLVLLQKGAAALPYSQVHSHLAIGDLVVVGRPKLASIERPIHAVKRRDTVLPVPLTRTARQVNTLLAVIKADVASS